MNPIQTIPLNLNFRQNQAHIWKVRIMPWLFMPLTFQPVNRQKPRAELGTCTPFRHLLKGLIVLKPKIFAKISPIWAWFFNFGA